eukprot:1282308-Rhodomonas_salina.1
MGKGPKVRVRVVQRERRKQGGRGVDREGTDGGTRDCRVGNRGNPFSLPKPSWHLAASSAPAVESAGDACTRGCSTEGRGQFSQVGVYD